MANPSNNGQAAVTGGMWSSAARGRHVNDDLPQDFFLLAPTSSFQYHHPDVAAVSNAAINFDSHSFNASNAIGIGVGVIPLLTATPYLAPAPSLGGEDVFNNARNRGATDGGGMRQWQWQHQQVQNSSAYLKKSMAFDLPKPLPSEIGASSSSTCGVSASCQDCGNQAKKDCPHRRCRTCCKSRGYDCATHLRSTWVPAARRRERQLVAETTATAGSSQTTSGVKKPKLGSASKTITTTASNTNSNTTPRSIDTTSSHPDSRFRDSLPGQVRAQAVFKCVKVTALDDGADEYAYQAAARIGGHLFQGFLYDQGFEGRDGFPNMSELYFSGGGGGIISSTPVIDPSEMYTAASGGGLLGGSGYGNPIN